ncbi:Dihydrofolate synthase/folylpolyglutamate synthase [Serratia symbiotica]|nr:Dihydrofolate synthase/folylpolyglutamate synthase [Serratia symbiotica]
MQNYPIIPQATSPLYEWLYYLENLHSKSIDLSLERVQHVASHLDLLSPAPTVFTVAGTNGKGTTCCTLEAILLAANLRVGVYTSPHLLRYTERVRIQGQELNESDFSNSFATIDKGRCGTTLTYFEFSTLSALNLFKQARLDVVILEVGLGGRLDATNIVDPNVAVITSIALDHTEWLGNNRDSIGSEKAGIFRSGKPAVVGEPNMPLSIQKIAEKLGVPLYCNGIAWSYNENCNQWQWKGGKIELAGLPIPHVPLVNAATALATLSYSSLDIGHRAICVGLKLATLPGRFQLICQEPRLILDVAHNPHAAAYLATRLSSLPRNGGKVRAVIGMLLNKDIVGTLACLHAEVDEWYCASLDAPRGAPAELLAQHLPQSRQFIDVASAWREATFDADKTDIVIVFGSFHTVAQVMVALNDRGGG